MIRNKEIQAKEIPLERLAYVRGSEWFLSADLDMALKKDGWKTSDTYGREYVSTPEAPGIYLFSLNRAPDYDRSIIAYVGMSKNISKRAYGKHHVKDKITTSNLWPMVWFKPCAEEALREEERRYIGIFDPPYNIVGRKFGIEGVVS